MLHSSRGSVSNASGLFRTRQPYNIDGTSIANLEGFTLFECFIFFLFFLLYKPSVLRIVCGVVKIIDSKKLWTTPKKTKKSTKIKKPKERNKRYSRQSNKEKVRNLKKTKTGTPLNNNNNNKMGYNLFFLMHRLTASICIHNLASLFFLLQFIVSAHSCSITFIIITQTEPEENCFWEKRWCVWSYT